jgi:hypothetical protein
MAGGAARECGDRRHRIDPAVGLGCECFEGGRDLGGMAKPNALPIQFSTKFELVINLNTAKAIGLTIPESFLLLADEVIQ